MTRAAAGKVVSLEDARASAASWRAGGERIVLARGAFDLLDAGLVRHLSGARAAGRLVVAVYGDRAAARGPGTPVLPAADRAALVAALRAVDLVVIVEEADAAAAVTVLGPDTLAVPPGEPATAAERDAAGASETSISVTGDPGFGPERGAAARVRALKE
jgi:bifunctional ADP-heptose synthase (sugar kinase/adenylyltransferase)